MVVQRLCKATVAGSSPVGGSETMKITKSPNGTHDIVRVFSDGIAFEFRSYELLDPTHLKLAAMRKLREAGYSGDVEVAAEDVVDALMLGDD